MTNVHLQRGDCLELMRALPDNSVDLVLTDPPYFKVKDEPWDNQWAKPQGFLAWLDTVVDEFQRVLKPNGSLYLFASPQMATRVELLISERFDVLNSIRWHKASGWHKKARKEDLRSYLTPWEAVIFAEQFGSDLQAGGHSGEAFLFGPVVDYLRGERAAAGVRDEEIDAACGWRTKAFHFFARNMSNFVPPTRENYAAMAIAFPGHFARRYDDLRSEYDGLQSAYEAARRPFTVTAETPHTDLWTFDPVRPYPGKHPCEKPQALLEHIITASSRPGAVVLDAFMGTGSTGIACSTTGRDFIGMEMNAAYVEIARGRIAGAQIAGADNDNRRMAETG